MRRAEMLFGLISPEKLKRLTWCVMLEVATLQMGFYRVERRSGFRNLAQHAASTWSALQAEHRRLNYDFFKLGRLFELLISAWLGE